MIFPCSACGLCCQNISSVNELKDFDLGNGVCIHFDSINNSCTIYEDRPNICKVDEMFQIKYKQYFTKEAFYMENAKVCNALQEEYNLDESFRIKIRVEICK